MIFKASHPVYVNPLNAEIFLKANKQKNPKRMLCFGEIPLAIEKKERTKLGINLLVASG